MIFTKSYCPYCKELKELLTDGGVSHFWFIDIDLIGEDGVQIQNTLEQLTGQSTVPNLFIGGVQVGGLSEAKEAAENG